MPNLLGLPTTPDNQEIVKTDEDLTGVYIWLKRKNSAKTFNGKITYHCNRFGLCSVEFDEGGGGIINTSTEGVIWGKINEELH